MAQTSAPTGLAPKSVSGLSLFFITVSGSAPMTVIAGGVVATYATAGIVGTPLSLLILSAALALFTVGYVAMSRYVSHAGVFYALLARGLGRVWGMSGSLVALVAYNAIQISLYGLFGATMAGLAGSVAELPWWGWSFIIWLVIAVLGVLRIRVNTRVLAVVLTAEILLIVLFDAASFANPAEGVISLTPLSPSALFVDGVGGVLALGIAAFIGYEVGPVYAEEVRGRHVVARATFATIIFIGLFYTISSWAMATAFGPTDVVDAARDPESGIPFSILEQFYGPLAALLANLLLITSIFAALLSFHHSVARYVFALSRERVLPSALDHIGPGSGAPIGGSLIQSAVALVVVGAFAIAGADPIIQLFAWLSTLAALGVLVLMTATSLAVVAFFQRGNGTDETAWQRVVAPTLGGFALLAILVVSVVNLSSVLGVEPGSPLTWILPGIIGVSAVVGLAWGVILNRFRPLIYNNIGRGQPRPLAVLEHSLADIEV